MIKFKKKYISFLMLVAFVISTMMPFLANYDLQPNSAAQELSKLFGGKILICTANGFKWVSVEDLTSEKQHLPPSHYKCPLCYIAAKAPSKNLVSTNSFFAYNFSNISITYSLYNYNPKKLNVSGSAQSRAPPFSFAA